MLSLAVASSACASGAAEATHPPDELPVPSRDARPGVSVPEVALPDPETASTVTIEELLAWADTHAPRLDMARAETLRAEALRAAADQVLPANPELELALGGRTLGAQTFLQAEIGIEQALELGGERELRREAAERAIEASLAGVDRLRWALHVRVHELALRALLARERAETATDLVGLAENLADITRRRIEAGEEAPMVALVVEAERAAARALVLEAEGNERSARIALATVIGWPEPTVPPIAGSLPPAVEPPPLEVLVAHAVERDPTLHALALEMEAAEARVALEDREAWPEPRVGFTYAHEGEPDTSANIWLFTLGLPLPLWDVNQGARAEARAELEIARTQLTSETLLLRAAIAEAVGRLDIAAERVELYAETIVPTAREHLALEIRAWELGEIDILQVSQMRERVLESLLDALDARAEYYAARSELEALLGTEIDDLLSPVNP